MASKQFVASDIITDAVDRCFALIQQYHRGVIVPWSAIESTSGFARQSTHWSAFLRRFRRKTRDERGIVLWPVTGVGLQLCTVEDQLRRVPLARAARAARQLKRGHEALSSIDDKELSLSQRDERFMRAMLLSESIVKATTTKALLARPESVLSFSRVAGEAS